MWWHAAARSRPRPRGGPLCPPGESGCDPPRLWTGCGRPAPSPTTRLTEPPPAVLSRVTTGAGPRENSTRTARGLATGGVVRGTSRTPPPDCVNSPGRASRAPSARQRASSAPSTAVPPWPCNSRTASPVNDCGAGKKTASPLSSSSPPAPRNVATVAMRGTSTRPVSAAAIAGAAAPDTRITPIPPRPGGVAIAAIVSGDGFTVAPRPLREGLGPARK